MLNASLNKTFPSFRQVKRLQVDRDTLFASNKSLAETNLSLEPKFTQLKRDVGTLYEDVNTHKMDLAKNAAKLGTMYSIFKKCFFKNYLIC